MSKNHKNFVIQRKEDGQFWTGDNNWTTDAATAISYPSHKEAVIGFTLDYLHAKGPMILFDAVSRYTAH